MQNLENPFLYQEFFLKIIIFALAFIFIGACLTGFVGLIIFLTSGGSEARNDKAVAMFKSALGTIVTVLIFYGFIVLYANFMHLSLK